MANGQLGFTLIELAVVISILAILTTVGLAAFVSYSRTQTIASAASDLSTILNLAKSRSFSQVKPEQCVNQSLDGYKVLIFLSSNSYEMDAVCSGNVYKIKSVNLPQNVVFSSDATTSTSFFFPVISGGVLGSGSVVLSGFGQTRTITVDLVGTVK